MTLNHFIDAIAGKLKSLWPDRDVMVNEIPQGADGNFFVGLIDAEQGQRLDRRRVRTMQFEILYFLRKKDNLEFNSWAEDMLDNFESISVVEVEGKTRNVRLTNVEVRKDDNTRVFQFLFDVNLNYLLAPAGGENMEVLEQEEVLK